MPHVPSELKPLKECDLEELLVRWKVCARTRLQPITRSAFYMGCTGLLRIHRILLCVMCCFCAMCSSPYVLLLYSCLQVGQKVVSQYTKILEDEGFDNLESMLEVSSFALRRCACILPLDCLVTYAVVHDCQFGRFALRIYFFYLRPFIWTTFCAHT